jgi:hypothetical protein
MNRGITRPSSMTGCCGYAVIPAAYGHVRNEMKRQIRKKPNAKKMKDDKYGDIFRLKGWIY